MKKLHERVKKGLPPTFACEDESSVGAWKRLCKIGPYLAAYIRDQEVKVFLQNNLDLS